MITGMTHTTQTSTECSVIAVVRALRAFEPQVSRDAAALVAPSQNEPDNVSYETFAVNGEPATTVFIERWRDRAAFERHLETPHMRAFLESGEQRFAEAPTVMFLEPIGGAR
jgi:quinol monooxygenase YgiN